MEKPRIFLGSSGQQEKLLQALTRGLADIARSLGVDFRFGQSVEGLEMAGDRITGVRTGVGSQSTSPFEFSTRTMPFGAARVPSVANAL